AGGTPVCDAEDPSDLDRIVAAVIRLTPRYPVALMGTGAMARAIGERLRPTEEGRSAVPPERDSPLLLVVGTLAASAREQVSRLVAAGADHVVVSAADLADDRALGALTGRIRRALRRGVAVVSLDRRDGWHRDQIALLATAIPPALDPRGADLVLTGGETARRVLDELGVEILHPREEIDTGAVLSAMPDGSSVVTRPGSFGSPDSLVEIVGRLRPTFALAMERRS
ncbi:MAG TPA: nucleotide-binding domain containing protein, partial [Pseudolysinimonas sp.]|nr:nucleotide-binding domain containing protein [Pseudolysinimonas sp.]